MPAEESLYPGDWVRFAEQDVHRVYRTLEDEDAGLAGFCLQQALEKYLKAFLLSKGWELRRIHNLEVLLEDALEYAPSWDIYRSVCVRVSAFYLFERYPYVSSSSLSLDDVRQELSTVEELIQHVKAAIE